MTRWGIEPHCKNRSCLTLASSSVTSVVLARLSSAITLGFILNPSGLWVNLFLRYFARSDVLWRVAWTCGWRLIASMRASRFSLFPCSLIPYMTNSTRSVTHVKVLGHPFLGDPKHRDLPWWGRIVLPYSRMAYIDRGLYGSAIWEGLYRPYAIWV